MTSGTPIGVRAVFGIAFRGYRYRGTPGYPLEPLQGGKLSIERCGACSCRIQDSRAAGHPIQGNRSKGPGNHAAGARTSVSAPLGLRRKIAVPMGREQIWIGPAPVRWASNRAPRPPGARDRMAGGRTSVSAPLGVCRETTVPMGREQLGIGAALLHFDARTSFVVRRPPSLNIHVLKGVGGPQAFSAHRGGGFRMVAQWSGHRGPAAGGRESRVEKVESRHGGPRSRGVGSGPLRWDARMGADWGFWSPWFVPLGG